MTSQYGGRVPYATLNILYSTVALSQMNNIDKKSNKMIQLKSL